MTTGNITGNCETCKPCGDCKGDGPIPYRAESAESPCDFCDPCSSSRICSYCSNGSCRCDFMVETEDGIMHEGCADIYYKQIKEIQKTARHICQITRGGNLEFEKLGTEVNEASKSLSVKDVKKTEKIIFRIASQLNEFCKLLPEGKRELASDVVEAIGQAIEFPDKLEKIELALAYVSSAVESSLQTKTNSNEIIFCYLRNIEFSISTLKFSSGSARQDLLKLQTDINKLRSQIELQSLSLAELETDIQEKDQAMDERLEKTRVAWLQTVEEMAQGFPKSEEIYRILTEIQVLKQSKKRDVLGITGDISSIAGLFIGLTGQALTL